MLKSGFEKDDIWTTGFRFFNQQLAIFGRPRLLWNLRRHPDVFIVLCIYVFIFMRIYVFIYVYISVFIYMRKWCYVFLCICAFML